MLFDGTIGLFQTLKEIGLTSKEAGLFVAMHDIGPNPASVIAKKCGLNRTGCYSLLNTMAEKGYVQKIIKNNILYFRATDPHVILRQLKLKKGRLDRTIENISHLISQFGQIQKDRTIKPGVVFFEGAHAFQNIMEDTLSHENNLRAYLGTDTQNETVREYWRRYEIKRAKKNIRMKLIFPANTQNYLRKLNDKFELRESRLIPPEFNFSLNIVIYGTKVSTASLHERFGLTIESEEISRACKKIYDLIFEMSADTDRALTELLGNHFHGRETEL